MNSTAYSRFIPLTMYSGYDKSKEENIIKPKKLFVNFVVEYLRNSCKRRSDNYKRMYMNTVSHVIEYCQINDIKELYTNDIDMEFCENFIYFLQSDKNQMQNTVKGNLERVHAMLHKAALYGYPVNNTYEEIHVEEEEVSSVYFSMTEITRMFYYSGLTRFQREVLDHFLIGCLTGLRYSDYSRLNESNFIRETNQISIKTKKTGVAVTIPMHKFVREILKKYNYNLPKPRHIAYFNRSIKDISRKIGFNEKILWERTVGTKVVTEIKEKWQLVSSHTARRSFATNMFLQKDIPTYRIMLITGHRSEKSFFKYIRVTREENAFTLAGHPFFQ